MQFEESTEVKYSQLNAKGEGHVLVYIRKEDYEMWYKRNSDIWSAIPSPRPLLAMEVTQKTTKGDPPYCC